MEAADNSRGELHYAVLDGKFEVVERLLSGGHVVGQPDEVGLTPLHFAAQQNRVDIARLLIASGADVNALDMHGNSPLWKSMFSAGEGISVVDLLLEAGSDPFHKNNSGKSSFDLSRLMASEKIARAFLRVIPS